MRDRSADTVSDVPAAMRSFDRSMALMAKFRGCGAETSMNSTLVPGWVFATSTGGALSQPPWEQSVNT